MFLSARDDAEDESASPPILEKEGGLSINRSISRVGLSVIQDQSIAQPDKSLLHCICSQTFDHTTLGRKVAELSRQ